MWRRVGALGLLGSLVLLSGCGPLQRPMPTRLDQEGQKQIDQSWDEALTPVDRLNRQQVLDVLVSSFAFEVGVDRLAFRSEKEFRGGLVVMEIHYDRRKPDGDRFEVTVFDGGGKELRHERYSRQDVEQTCHVFYDQLSSDHPTQQERAARWKHVEQFFPNAQQHKPAAQKAGQ
jgi:hypothetical protein